MKKFIRVLVAIVLVAILLYELGSCAFNMFGPQDDDVVSTVGEVVSVEPHWLGYLNDEEHQRWACYYIYVRPVGKGNNEELLLFTVNCDTEMESEFGADRSKIPELQVGSVVEVAHTYKMPSYGDMHPDDDRRNYLRGYEALSISIYEGEYKGRQTVLQKNPDFWWGEGFHFAPTIYGSHTALVVSHVAKVTYPMAGYLVYGYENHGAFMSERVMWLGVGVFLDGATRQALESGAVGWTLWFNDETGTPFLNLNADQCVYASVNVADEFAQHEKYKVYDIDEFVGTKKILVRTDRFDGKDFYYYIKLESGEIKAVYSEKSQGSYVDLCEVDAKEEPAKGVFPTTFPSGEFPGEIYITLESVGDIPASGELVISFIPLEETDYFRNKEESK